MKVHYSEGPTINPIYFTKNLPSMQFRSTNVAVPLPYYVRVIILARLCTNCDININIYCLQLTYMRSPLRSSKSP